jgi:hypothetical protein
MYIFIYLHILYADDLRIFKVYHDYIYIFNIQHIPWLWFYNYYGWYDIFIIYSWFNIQPPISRDDHRTPWNKHCQRCMPCIRRPIQRPRRHLFCADCGAMLWFIVWTIVNGAYDGYNKMAITCYKILVLQENGDVGSLYTYRIIWMFRVPASAPGDHSVTFNTRAFDGSCATFWKARRPDKYT